MTTPVLDGPPARGHNGPPDNRPVYAQRQCPECMVTFKPRVANTLFCCTAHAKAWNNRWTARGSKTAQYLAVARQTRDGTRGTPEQRAVGNRAAAIYRRFMQDFRDEDREAGRMPIIRYMAERWAVMDAPL